MTVPEGVHGDAGRRRARRRPADRVRDATIAADCGWRRRTRYPLRAPEGEGRDRILIFEDTNGDGRLDRRKVFIDKLNLVSGLEVGFGGVWVGAAPYLLFIPMKEGADRPSGPPQVLLDGWGYEDTHETLNTFTWGPDGWLYGAHGVFTHSKVGKPGAPDAERTPLNAGDLALSPDPARLRSVRRGHEQSVGARLQRLRPRLHDRLRHRAPVSRRPGRDGTSGRRTSISIRYTYDDIKTIADHRALGGQRRARTPPTAARRAAGGGHAHAGAMIYLGGDGWPAEYRNAILMNNIHGFRTNMDRLERAGSGYTASHGPDFLLANDAWSQMLNFQYGPDGSVHVIDWYDKNQCHSINPELHQKTLGRIFKISHESDRPVRSTSPDCRRPKLVALQLHRNDWYVQHARRLLQERGPDAAVHAASEAAAAGADRRHARLRAMWALHVTGGLTEADLLALLDDDSEYVRGWAITLLVEGAQPSDDRAPAFRRARARRSRRRWCGSSWRARCSACRSRSGGTSLARSPAARRRRDRSQPGADGVVCGRAARRAGHAARPRPRGETPRCPACSPSPCSASPTSARRRRSAC